MDRRYKKRMAAHWARERVRALRAVESRDYSSWFDLWHTHSDWKSRGTRFLEDRDAVAAITYEVLLRAESLAGKSGNSIQVFATICEDTGSNAVYIHSENPNGTEFPHTFPTVEWGVEGPPELVGLVNLATHEVGRAQYEDSVDYIIRKRA